MLVAVVISAVLALHAQAPPAAVFPDDAWEYVPSQELGAHGWSSAALRKTMEFIRDESNTTGLVVVDRGRVVFRYGDIEELSYVASVRKSILAMLYGYWVENGTIDLDTTLAQLQVDDIGGLLPIEKQATIGHVITARSGVYHPASYSGDDLADAPHCQQRHSHRPHLRPPPHPRPTLAWHRCWGCYIQQEQLELIT
jgi:CubicO group peptidase (beta-lactamase class C family)